MVVGVIVALILAFLVIIQTAYRRNFTIGTETYAMERMLGIGTEGIVCAARRTRDQTRVALKWIWNPLRLSCDQSLAALVPDHPHLVPVYDVGQDSILGVSWIVYGYCPGTGMNTWIQNESPDPSLIRIILRDIGSGLVSLHARGLVHGDVIPKNVLVDPKTNQARLCDYGRMRRMGANGTVSSSMQGVFRCDYRDTESYPERTSILPAIGAKWTCHAPSPPERFDETLVRNETYDTWMWACTLLCVLTGRATPYADDHFNMRRRLDVRAWFVRTRGWESWPEWAEQYPRSHRLLFDLLQHAFVYDPRERWTVRACLSHPWFTTTSFP